MELYTSVEPFFAPLSKPMWMHALECLEDAALLPPMQKAASTLRSRLTQLRQETFELMQPIVRNGELTTPWMLKTLAQYTPKEDKARHSETLSKETASQWRKIGLVHYAEYNTPDPDSGAALIVLRRLISHKARFWLPSPPKEQRMHYFTEEPRWWCWRQDSPDSPVVPCPVPLPSDDLPASALLWTDWLGAAWKPEWMKIGSLGCCRWAGTMVKDDKLFWALTEEDLNRWGVPISAPFRSALKQDLPLTRHMVAQTALLLLATERLEEAKAFTLESLPPAI